jgi:very-short-patch-repair endonuclease
MFIFVFMAKISGREEYPIFFGAKPEILRLAGELRHSMTGPERILWERIRDRQLLGYRFRRQHPFNVIILDFFCYELMLSIELDGRVHDTPYQKERDKERTEILKRFGITELRFTNNEVETNLEFVVEKITMMINQIHPK